MPSLVADAFSQPSRTAPLLLLNRVNCYIGKIITRIRSICDYSTKLPWNVSSEG